MRIKELFTASNFVHLSIFIFFIFGMVLKNSYNVAIILLLLTSIYVVIRYRKEIDFSKGKPLVVIFLLYAIVVILANLFGGHGDRDYESPARFLLAIPIVYAMTYIRVNRTFLMVCIALGAIAMGILAIYQVYDVHYYKRAGLYPIRFGNIGMLVAFFCIAGLQFIPKQLTISRQNLLKICLFSGSVAGLIASFLSGSRGGWVYPLLGVPIVLIAVTKNSTKVKRDLCILSAIGIIILGIIYIIPSTGVEKRVNDAIAEIKKYEPNEKTSLTSVGARFEMWRLSLELIKEHPFVGWGLQGYKDKMESFVKNKEAKKVVLHRHPHNEILNEATKRGVLAALIVLVGIYGVGSYLFYRGLSSSDGETRYYATLGCLMIVGWFVFGLTDVFLEHNQMIIYFIFYITLFFGGIVYSAKNKIEVVEDISRV